MVVVDRKIMTQQPCPRKLLAAVYTQDVDYKTRVYQVEKLILLLIF